MSDRICAMAMWLHLKHKGKCFKFIYRWMKPHVKPLCRPQRWSQIKPMLILTAIQIHPGDSVSSHDLRADGPLKDPAEDVKQIFSEPTLPAHDLITRWCDCTRSHTSATSRNQNRLTLASKIATESLGEGSADQRSEHTHGLWPKIKKEKEKKNQSINPDALWENHDITNWACRKPRPQIYFIQKQFI